MRKHCDKTKKHCDVSHLLNCRILWLSLTKKYGVDSRVAFTSIGKPLFPFQKALGPYSFTIWMGCTLVFLIYQVLFIPDTKGRTPEQIQERFK